MPHSMTIVPCSGRVQYTQCDYYTLQWWSTIVTLLPLPLLLPVIVYLAYISTDPG